MLNNVIHVLVYMRCDAVVVGEVGDEGADRESEESSDGGARRMYSGIWFPSSGSDLTKGRVTTL